MSKQIAKHHRFYSAFTIVELLIVVVVIAILATIVTVAYNGVQRNATQSVLQTTAREVAKAMEVKKVDLGLYPVEIPDSVTTPSGTGIGITQVGDTNSYCFNVTTTRYNDVFYSIDQTQSIKEALCPGQVLATKGDYNTNAGGVVADSWVTQSTVGKAVAPGDMGFTVETNETWTQLTLSWNAMPGATQYRINQQNSPTGTWYVRNTSTSSGWSWDTGSYSGAITPSTTSLTWTANIPTALDQTYGYRIQYKKSDGTWSDWQQLSLSPSTGRTLPTIRNFKVTPNATWSNLTLSWDSIGKFADLPSVKIRINQRNSSTSTWYVMNSSGGGLSSDSTSYSGSILPTTTSVNWTYAIPPNASSIYEYRIQVYSGSTASEWSTFSLNPLQDTALPKVTNFKVTPNATWSSITLSWDGMGTAFSNLPAVKYRINQRNSSTSAWYVLSTSGGAYSWDAPSYSGSILPTTTSVDWTYGIPPNASSIYEYRIQIYSGTATSDWTTFSLNPLEGTTLPKVNNFKVTPAADWSKITLSWDGIGTFANLPSVKFRINQRNSPSSAWYVLSTSGGAYSWDAPSYSGSVLPTTTSIDWTYGIPPSGSTYEYRIQPYSGTATGEWATFSLPR